MGKCVSLLCDASAVHHKSDKNSGSTTAQKMTGMEGSAWTYVPLESLRSCRAMERQLANVGVVETRPTVVPQILRSSH